MTKSNNYQLLTDEQRTVTFSDEEARAIHRMIREFSPGRITDALEEVIQEILFSNDSSLGADVGSAYFALREVRHFYARIYERITPVWSACEALLLDPQH